MLHVALQVSRRRLINEKQRHRAQSLCVRVDCRTATARRGILGVGQQNDCGATITKNKTTRPRGRSYSPRPFRPNRTMAVSIINTPVGSNHGYPEKIPTDNNNIPTHKTDCGLLSCVRTGQRSIPGKINFVRWRLLVSRDTLFSERRGVYVDSVARSISWWCFRVFSSRSIFRPYSPAAEHSEPLHVSKPKQCDRPFVKLRFFSFNSIHDLHKTSR